MKSLPLKSFKVGEQEATYKELIRSCLNNVPQGGLDPEAMRERIKVLEVLESACEVLEIEDAVAETLKKCVESMKWAVVNKDVLALCDEVKAM